MSKKYSGKKFDDLSDWRLFIKLCRQQSLSAVANATGLDSSTISRRISSLEERPGQDVVLSILSKNVSYGRGDEIP